MAQGLSFLFGLRHDASKAGDKGGAAAADETAQEKLKKFLTPTKTALYDPQAGTLIGGGALATRAHPPAGPRLAPRSAAPRASESVPATRIASCHSPPQRSPAPACRETWASSRSVHARPAQSRPWGSGACRGGR